LNSEPRVKKKKNIVLAGLLVGLALVLTSCLFDSDANGVESWLSDHGMPSTYKMQKVNVNLNVASAEVFLDSTPKSADAQSPLGRFSNIAHDLYMDIALTPDTNFLRNLRNSDSASATLLLFWDKGFYFGDDYPADSLFTSEDVDFTVSWILDVCESGNALDSITNIGDTTWYKSLHWEKFASADTSATFTMSKNDSTLFLHLPSALVDSLKTVKKGSIHLQMRLSAPEAKRVFRFYGDGTLNAPIMSLFADSSISFYPFRMADVVRNMEECAECLILHGGVRDSMVVEIPSEPIMKALSEFYGDEFPFTEGDKNDVRQSVVLAELTMARDDSQGSNEMGLPIQVVVGSFVDSANTTVRRMENYRLNNDVILERGHQNLVFHEGDSLTLQLTIGAKEMLNKARDGRSLKFMMRLGYPFLQEKDTNYVTYATANGDTNYVFSSYLDYARYDFSSSFEKPVSLKLWLASKRGDE